MGDYDPEEILFIVQGEMEYTESLDEEQSVQKYSKIADEHGFIRDFLFLCDRWRIQKKEDGRTDENDTQYTVEQASLSPPYILYDKLGVSGSKEPVPVQYGCQQGDDACDGKNPLNDVLAHGELKIIN